MPAKTNSRPENGQILPLPQGKESGEKVLGYIYICEGVVVPKGGREITQGHHLRLETAPVLLYRFLIIGVEP